MIGNDTKSKWAGRLLAAVLITAVALTGLTGCSETAGTAAPDKSPNSAVSGRPPDTASPDASVPPDGTDTETLDGTADPNHANEPYPSMEPRPSEAPMPSPEPQPSTGVVRAFEGQWVVSSVLAYGNAGTYSKEDAEKLIGKTLSFLKEEATLINDQPTDSPTVYKSPSYREGSVTSGDFPADFGISFDKLGITGDSVSSVEVSVPDAGGCMLLMKSSNTMILIAGGTFFELTRSS